MQLIDEGFRAWWKKYSVIALVLIGALQTAWATSPELQQHLSPEALSYVTGALAWLGAVGRFIKQTQAALPDEGGGQ